QDVLELLPTEPALLQHQLVDTTAGIERLARDCACTLVADVGNERGDDADAALDDTANMLAVGGDAADAPLAQNDAALREHIDRLEDVEGDHRLEDVELELSCLRCQGDGGVVADHLEARLVDHLGDDGVDLARHDARARLHRRQVDLGEAGTRTAREQAQVIADLRQFDRNTLEHAGHQHERARVLCRVDQVRAGDEIEAGNLAECATYGLGVAGVRVDARADRGGAHVDLAHERSRFTEPIDVFIDRYAVRVELL